MKTKSATYIHPGMRARPYLNPAIRVAMKSWSAVAKRVVGRVSSIEELQAKLITARNLIAMAAAARASTTAPKDTGTLRNSITAKENAVGTNVKYAPYVEYGVPRHTRKRKIIR